MNDKTEKPLLPDNGKIEGLEAGGIEKTATFPKVVWDCLSRIDVGDHIQTAEVKKDGHVVYSYQYLSWSWAWAQLMSNFPESDFDIGDEVWLENSTVMVTTQITVRDGGQELTRPMWLPVMNQANNSIENPTTRQISDARMRCIVKNLAMGFGLGLDLWAGSDVPVGAVDDPISEAKVELLSGLFDRLDEKGKAGFLAWLDVPGLSFVTESRYQSARKQLERKIQALGK
jgi:hypothetical protein